LFGRSPSGGNSGLDIFGNPIPQNFNSAFDNVGNNYNFSGFVEPAAANELSALSDAQFHDGRRGGGIGQNVVVAPVERRDRRAAGRGRGSPHDQRERTISSIPPPRSS
jgi:hypothetical protein